mgnify:CR=1 FL=1
MHFFKRIFSCLTFAFFHCSVMAQTPSETISFNQNWQFQKSTPKATSFEPKGDQWQQVNIPHSPVLEPLVVNDQWQGVAVYQKNFIGNPAWQNKTLYLRFEGAMNVAKVWLNGEYLGQHVGGYLPFTFDISDAVRFSKNNLLTVQLDNNDNYITGPKPLHLLDFNTYGGLYRDVNLIVKSPVHISDEMFANQVSGGGQLITTKILSDEKATVKVKTSLRNTTSSKANVLVKHQLLWQGQVVATSQSSTKVNDNSQTANNQTLEVLEAQLWHPNHPHLYQLETQVFSQNNLLDAQQTPIGIREFTFNEQHQLLINGKETFLRGVNRHQEYPFVGYATSADADYRDAVKIKSAGFDYVRLSHYPHSKAFMAAADELGLVLIDAVLGWQYYSPFPEFEQQIYQTCRDLIRRDRNHPSVLAWECSLNESYMPDHFVNTLKTIIEQELPGAYSAGWQTQYDIYLQARQHRLQHYDKPTQPYNVSEYGDWEYYAQNAGLNQDAWADLQQEERTSRQLITYGEQRLLQQAKNIQEAHNDNLSTPAYSDGYWVMFDYNRGYADDLEASGIMSIFRQPKYSYYFYQSQRDPAFKSTRYESGPMVFIASDWLPDSNTEVTIFSNAEEVELLLNGETVGRSKPDNSKISSHLNSPPFKLKVKEYAAGELKAVAYIKGEVVAEHIVRTPQAATYLELSVDKSGRAINYVDGDVVFINAVLKDKQGQAILSNGKVVEVTAKGDVSVLNTSAIKTQRGVATLLLNIPAGSQGFVLEVSAGKLNATLTEVP